MFFSDQIFIHYWKGDQPASPHGSLLDISGVGDAGYELIFFYAKLIFLYKLTFFFELMLTSRITWFDVIKICHTQS